MKFKRGVEIKIKNLLLKLIRNISIVKKTIINLFHLIYFDSYKTTMNNTYWLGNLVQKIPLDPWIYQEIVYYLKPDLIIECGTGRGGSAFYFASICDLLNKGIVVTTDTYDFKDKPPHDRIHYIIGDSTSEIVVEKIKTFINEKNVVMVVLDSDHHKEHVLNELRIYSQFVSKGSYIIVEDSNINGHPVLPHYGPGPMEAIKDFLKENHNFIIDKTKEKFYLTFNPKGYLKKIN